MFEPPTRVLISDGGGGDGAQQDFLRVLTGHFGKTLFQALALDKTPMDLKAVLLAEDYCRRSHAWRSSRAQPARDYESWHAAYTSNSQTPSGYWQNNGSLVKDFRHERRSAAHLKVSGKGSKTQYVPLHPAASGLIVEYLEADGRGSEMTGALFRAIRGRGDGLAKAITGDLQDRAGVFGKAWLRDRSARAAGDGGDECARSPGRHRQGARVARAREHRDDANLRPPENEG